LIEDGDEAGLRSGLGDHVGDAITQRIKILAALAREGELLTDTGADLLFGEGTGAMRIKEVMAKAARFLLQLR
jgi:hypothetical protein